MSRKAYCGWCFKPSPIRVHFWSRVRQKMNVATPCLQHAFLYRRVIPSLNEPEKDWRLITAEELRVSHEDRDGGFSFQYRGRN